MSHLERVLRDLEVATAALAPEELQGRRGKLRRRAQAIARLAEAREAILSLSPAEFQAVMGRLTRAANAGEAAGREMERQKQKVMAEWSRWNQVHQSLAAGAQRRPKNVDCRG
jgi:hypothetical protein